MNDCTRILVIRVGYWLKPNRQPPSLMNNVPRLKRSIDKGMQNMSAIVWDYKVSSKVRFYKQRRSLALYQVEVSKYRMFWKIFKHPIKLVGPKKVCVTGPWDCHGFDTSASHKCLQILEGGLWSELQGKLQLYRTFWSERKTKILGGNGIKMRITVSLKKKKTDNFTEESY